MTSSNEKIICVEEELNNDTESQMQVQYDDLRLSKLGFRVRLARAINMLGANGISLYPWGVFFAIMILSEKIQVIGHGYREENHVFGVILLFVSKIYFFMFFFLVMKNKEKNLSGVTTMLKLICSFTGAIMLIACFGTKILDFIHYGPSSLNFSLLLIVPYTIIIDLLLYGIAYGKSWYVALYIAFALPVIGIMIPVLVVILALGAFSGTLNHVLILLVLIPVLIFKIGIFIALHSVLLDREMGLNCKINGEEEN